MIDFQIKNGSEGPKHDPWSYSEYACKGWTLHCGIGVHIIMEDGKRKDHEFGSNYEESEKDLIQEFERHSGLTISEMLNIDSQQELDPMGSPMRYI